MWTTILWGLFIGFLIVAVARAIERKGGQHTPQLMRSMILSRIPYLEAGLKQVEKLYERVDVEKISPDNKGAAQRHLSEARRLLTSIKAANLDEMRDSELEGVLASLNVAVEHVSQARGLLRDFQLPDKEDKG
jgi:hypothetical protein